jgi:hypothetical protein
MNIYASKFPTPKCQHQLDRYWKLINFILTNQHIVNGYCENHHILPASMGGTNDVENMIKLPARYHFLAHYFLWRAYRNKSTARAFTMMKTRRKDQPRYFKITSKMYAEAKSEGSVNTCSTEKRSKYVTKSYIDNSNLRKFRGSVFKSNWESNRDEMVKSSRENFKKAANTRRSCEYCEKSINYGTYATFHGKYCKSNPERIIHPRFLKT